MKSKIISNVSVHSQTWLVPIVPKGQLYIQASVVRQVVGQPWKQILL